jgi:uncharacterized protein
MSTRTGPWEPGTPCWADLGTSDVPAAQAFYAALFGWQANDLGEEFGHYAICTRDGSTTAGIGPVMSTDQPVAWTTYLATDDLDKALESVAGAGGTIVSPAMDIPGQGRMAVAIDPTGGSFGLWQAGAMIGAQLVNEPGAMMWNDHHSPDPEAARAFYATVFGFRYSPMEGPFDYASIDGAGPGGAIGGIGAPDPDLPPDTAAGWTAYFAVADTDEALAVATSHGGRTLAGPVDTPFGRMATVADPQGATFKIMGWLADGPAL